MNENRKWDKSKEYALKKVIGRQYCGGRIYERGQLVIPVYISLCLRGFEIYPL